MVKRRILIGVVVLALVMSIWFMLRPSKSGVLPRPLIDETISAPLSVSRQGPTREHSSARPARATAQNNGSISGRVLDTSLSYTPARLLSVSRYFSERNEPLAGVRILQRQGKEGPVIRQTVTDPNGRYTFQGLTEGYCTIEAEPPAGAMNLRYRPHTVRLQPGEQKEDVDFHFRLDSAVIAGQITDTRGYPIEGATVVADPVIGESYADARKSASILTDKDGRYRIEGLAVPTIRKLCLYITKGMKPKLATYAVGARAHGYTAVEVIFPSITDSLLREAQSLGYVDALSSAVVPLPTSCGNVINLDFVLEAEALVSGRLVDTLGKIVSKSRLRMVFADSQGKEPEPLAVVEVGPDSVETDEEGRFVFEGVPSGVYVFEVETQRAHNAPLKVGKGESIEDLDVIVESKGVDRNTDKHRPAQTKSGP